MTDSDFQRALTAIAEQLAKIEERTATILEAFAQTQGQQDAPVRPTASSSARLDRLLAQAQIDRQKGASPRSRHAWRASKPASRPRHKVRRHRRWPGRRR